jgi:photosystem II stability/assembly factor-like uncharacterized protein
MGCVVEDKVDLRFVPQIQSTAFYGPNNAWLVSSKGDLLKTDDGGRNWETISGSAIGEFDNVTFIGEGNGWANTRNGQVVRSTDGGRTWVSVARLGDKRYGFRLGQIKFIDEKHGWIVNPLQIWRTEDGGINWHRLASPQTPAKAVFYCSFVSPQVGWLSGSGGAFFRTQDGGKTWQEGTVLSEDKDLTELSFVDHYVGWVATLPSGRIYRTEDGGKTWFLLPEPSEARFWESVHFISKSEGWAAGTDIPRGDLSKKREHIVLRTTDGGETWERIKVAEDESLVSRIHFADSSHGWLLTRDNVYRTDDGGSRWRVVLRLPPAANQ